MAVSMTQGDKYAVPFMLQALDGTLITPNIVKTVVLNLGIQETSPMKTESG